MSEQLKYVTEEDLEGLSPNGRILTAMRIAEEHGDKEEVCRLEKLAIFSADSLMATKEVMGADYIRQRGWRTDDADKVYGYGWLDR